MTEVKVEKRNKKKVLITVAIWVAIVLLLSTVIFTIVNLSVVDNPNAQPYGKIRFSLDTGDSYLGAEKGDMLVVETIDDVSKLEVGDVITYALSDGRLLTRPITKKFPEPHANNSSTYCYMVGGELTYVHPNQVYGVYKIGGEEVGKIVNGYGKLVNFMRTGAGYFVFVVTPVLLIFAYFVMKLVLEILAYKNNKKDA